MKKTVRLLPIILILMLLAAVTAPAAGAEEVASPDETTTTTTTAPATVSIKNFYIIGSNDKYYLCSPEMTDSVDSYSFNIPDWMESATIYIKAAAGLGVSSDGIDFNEDSGVYRGKVSGITKSSQSYNVKLSSSSATRNLTITIKRSNIPCYFDSVSMYKGDSAVNSKGSITDGLTYNLASGTTGGVTIRIKPRHENQVTVTNLTGIAQPTGSEGKTTLDLNTRTMRYDYSPTLVEGTNVFKFTVSAGTVSKDCVVTVIVGEADANAPTTQATESTAASPVSDSSVIGAQDQNTTAPTIMTTTSTEKSGSDGSGLSPVLWVLIGAIVTIIAGAIIFMIVNLSRRDDYDDYEDDYAPPRRPRRRNLDDYADDEYDDYYEDDRPRRGRGDYGDYDDYDDYSYDSDSDRYSGRSQYRGEGGRSRRGGDYDDYDDYGGAF